MPFGLKNAPDTFKRAIDILLAHVKYRTCLVYIDDIIVFPNNLDDHLAHVRDVLEVLYDVEITSKLKNCDLPTDSFKYLGHIIRPGRLSVDEARVKSLKGAKHSKTQTGLQSFLRLCNVYRRFAPTFSGIALPLNRHITKGQPVKLEPFDNAEASVFAALVNTVTSLPVLALLRPGRIYEVGTNACSNQVGCALFQSSENGERHHVRY